MKRKEEEKIRNQEQNQNQEDDQLDSGVLLNIQGGAGLRGTVKTETTDISQDTKDKI